MPQGTRDEEVSMLTLACVRELLAKRVRLICLSEEQHRPSWANLHHFAEDLGVLLQHALHGNQQSDKNWNFCVAAPSGQPIHGHVVASHWAERSE
jgi:hypothetical protein